MITREERKWWGEGDLRQALIAADALRGIAKEMHERLYEQSGAMNATQLMTRDYNRSILAAYDVLVEPKP